MVLGAMAIGACGMIYEDFDPDCTDTSMLVRINTVSGGSRSIVSEGFENIATLRIILVDADGKVEYNRYFNDVSDYNFNDRHSGNFDFVITNLTPGEKTIYLFANEEGIHGAHITDNNITTSIGNFQSFLNSASKGSTDFAQNVDKIWFDGFMANWYLPYTAKYDVTLGKGSENYKPLFLVPAAVKFSFIFFNYRDAAVKFNSMKIHSIADRSFTLANVGGKDLYKKLPGSDDSLFWTDWLAAVAEASWQTDGDIEGNKNFNDTYGWISDYSVPSSTNHAPAAITDIPAIKTIPESSKTPSYTELVYLPESFNKVDDNRRKYSLSFDIADTDELHNVDFELPKVKELFRDTHVKVYITMKHTEFTVTTEVDVDPWDEDELNPEMGIRVWTGSTDVDPWDEDRLNPEFGPGNDGNVDNDPWDENEGNPNYGNSENGNVDNDPWDENEGNPDFGNSNNGNVDNDPWDENEGNPNYGGNNSGNVDNDPWDENEGNPDFGGNNNGNIDNDPWDENEGNPNYGGNNNGNVDNDPWDEKNLNPSFGKSSKSNKKSNKTKKIKKT